MYGYKHKIVTLFHLLLNLLIEFSTIATPLPCINLDQHLLSSHIMLTYFHSHLFRRFRILIRFAIQ